jgi:hypothetical protein
MQMQGDLKFKASMGYNSETLSQKKKGRREGRKEVYFGSWFWRLGNPRLEGSVW